MDKDIETCVAFPHYLKLSKEASDKVGFLTLSFKRLHPFAPQEDFINTGGRIAKIWVLCNKDTARALQIIWKTSADGIVGSHLNYIIAIVNKTPCNKTNLVNSGKYKRLD